MLATALLLAIGATIGFSLRRTHISFGVVIMIALLGLWLVLLLTSGAATWADRYVNDGATKLGLASLVAAALGWIWAGRYRYA